MERQFHVFDLHRIFIGDLPWTFTLEIVFRTSILYLYTLALIRFIGKRGLRELAVFEFVIIFALGSAVGDPMFYPEIPLFHGMVVVSTVVLLNRGLTHVLRVNRAVHDFVYPGRPACVVADRRVQLAPLKAERLRKEDLFMLLREEGVEHLGEVKRAFLEPTGELSVWKYSPGDVRPGLPLDPDPGEPMRASERPASPADHSCAMCGETVYLPADVPAPPCPRCSNPDWYLASTHGMDKTRTSHSEGRDAALRNG